MDQDVAKRDDAFVLADLRGEIFVELSQSRERLADDLELALDCRATWDSARSRRTPSRRGELRQEGGCTLNIEKVLLSLKPHREASCFGRRPAGSTGS